MLSLVIHHNIFLSKEQRYAIHNGEIVDCDGVSIPVWVSGASTSEPAKEIFCRYQIKNTNEQIPIKLVPNGFEINLPSVQGIGPPQSVTPEEWRAMSEHEKEELGAFQAPSISSSNLLDLKDGGNSSLMFREHSKIKSEDGTVIIVHLVQIKSIDKVKYSFAVIPKWLEDSPSTTKKASS